MKTQHALKKLQSYFLIENHMLKKKKKISAHIIPVHPNLTDSYFR